MTRHEKYLLIKAARHAAGLTANGSPWNPRKRLTLHEAMAEASKRFWSKVKKSDNCWEWTGGKNAHGYGKFSVSFSIPKSMKKTIAAHRASYIYSYGMPNGFVCHSCDNPSCVNLAHLWDGTPADNMRDKVEKGRQAKGKALSDAVLASVRNIRRGEMIYCAKLRSEMIPEIREMYLSGTRLGVIASKFGVSRQSVLNAAKGKTWRHVQ